MIVYFALFFKTRSNNTSMYAQEKYDKAMGALDAKEKRVVMAETMLEATLQYESGQSKASSPK